MGKITKIYVHRLSESMVFSELVKYRSLWNDKQNEVLFLFFAKDRNGNVEIYPREFERLNHLLFDMYSKGTTNMMMDIGASSYFMITSGKIQTIYRLGSLLKNLPYYID